MQAIGILFLVVSAFSLWLFLRQYGRLNHPILVVPILVCGMLIWGTQRKPQAAPPIEPSVYQTIQQRAEQILRAEEAKSTEAADTVGMVAR